MKPRKEFAHAHYPRFSLGARRFAVAEILHTEAPKRNMLLKFRVRVIACNSDLSSRFNDMDVKIHYFRQDFDLVQYVTRNNTKMLINAAFPDFFKQIAGG